MEKLLPAKTREEEAGISEPGDLRAGERRANWESLFLMPNSIGDPTGELEVGQREGIWIFGFVPSRTILRCGLVSNCSSLRASMMPSPVGLEPRFLHGCCLVSETEALLVVIASKGGT